MFMRFSKFLYTPPPSEIKSFCKVPRKKILDTALSGGSAIFNQFSMYLQTNKPCPQNLKQLAWQMDTVESQL